MRTLLSAASLFLALSAGAAALADKTEAHPCRYDIQRFCYGVERGGGQLHNCLRRHHDQLTPACQREVDSPRK